MPAEKPTYPAALRDSWLHSSDEELSAQCVLDFFKSTGRGGQKRNKCATAVRLIHTPTGLAATCDAERSQHRNRAVALAKLRREIALTCRTASAAPHPFGLSPENPNYIPELAYLLDLLDSLDYRVSDCAAKLAFSTSKLNNLLARDPELYALVNRARQERGLPVLKTNR